MALIKVGATYINTNDIQMITEMEKGTEEAKQFGFTIQTRFGKYQKFYEGRTERNEILKKILELMNGPEENMMEIRRKLDGINARINSIDRKVASLKEGKK